jgi:hypothetical protein
VFGKGWSSYYFDDSVFIFVTIPNNSFLGDLFVVYCYELFECDILARPKYRIERMSEFIENGKKCFMVQFVLRVKKRKRIATACI